MHSKPWPRWRVVSDDIDEHACLLQRWTQAHVQLECGRFEREVEGVVLGGRLQVFRERTNRRLHRVVTTPPDTCAVALLTADSEAMRFQNRPARAGDLLVFAAGREFDLVTLGTAEVIVVTLGTDALPPGLDMAGCRGDAMLPPSTATQDLAAAMRGVLAVSAKEREACLKRLQAQLACHLVDCLRLHAQEAGAHDTRRKELALPDAARRLLLARAQLEGQAPRVPEIADQLGISARRLHQLCCSSLGLPPRAYAERVRLARARSELRRSGPGGATVASVATRWGFEHLGRFSSLYRSFFGELPSHTVRN